MQTEYYNQGFRPKKLLTTKEARKYVIRFLIVASIYFLGFLYFALTIPRQPEFPNEKTDAIVTLTGETQRIVEGVKELNKQNANKYFISGIHLQEPINNVINKTISQLQKDKELNINHSILRAKIETGKAENTIENGLETAIWVKRNKIKSIRLLTSFYHMPRSKLIFEKYMPKDVIIIYHPILFEGKNPNPFTNFKLLKLVFSEYNKFLITYLWNLANLEVSTTLKLQGAL